ncbi:MAG: alkaline phosphatase [Bacteroidales bacterium]|nr:alkaline phosphatase [Bacteroidales bacterium]
MKRFFALSALLLSSAALWAQVEEGGTRALSRYANDTFRDDDRYTETQPYNTVSVEQVKGKKVKNIIFMIGDGMGLEQISTAWVLNGGHLNMDNMVYTGFSRTYAVDKLITDSCQGGTGLSTGTKTKYGYIAVDPDGNDIQSSLKLAQEKGKKTGVAVTCRVNDATPADFCCHSTDRDQQEEIAAQYVDSGLDFLCGGGLRYWQNREDGRDLVEEMKAKGYTFAATQEELKAAQGEKILSLQAPIELPAALDRGDYLPNAAMKAIESLDNKKGFFLMIEGSCIDDWCHANKVGYMAEELLDFDRTLGKVLEWAEKDGETLVIVTADHSTGGLTLVGGDLQKRSVKVHFSTEGHNGILVPVFAYGPHAADFVGVHENAEVGQLVKKLIK